MISFALIFIIIAIVLLMIYIVVIYNRFKALDIAAKTTLGQIRVALKKRLDMISQLVDSAKSYANFEKEVLENITRMRTSVMEASPQNLQEIERESRKLFEGIKIMVENYPELKTVETVNNLMAAITSVEDEIARHRYTYNNIVQEYNTMLVTFPSNIIGRIFNFSQLTLLQFEEEIEKRPEISLK